jgi:hypothetical protein
MTYLFKPLVTKFMNEGRFWTWDIDELVNSPRGKEYWTNQKLFRIQNFLWRLKSVLYFDGIKTVKTIGGEVNHVIGDKIFKVVKNKKGKIKLKRNKKVSLDEFENSDKVCIIDPSTVAKLYWIMELWEKLGSASSQINSYEVLHTPTLHMDYNYLVTGNKLSDGVSLRIQPLLLVLKNRIYYENDHLFSIVANLAGRYYLSYRDDEKNITGKEITDFIGGLMNIPEKWWRKELYTFTSTLDNSPSPSRFILAILDISKQSEICDSDTEENINSLVNIFLGKKIIDIDSRIGRNLLWDIEKNEFYFHLGCI